jgi:hypothetical protein
MSETAADLVDRVLPRVPVRQWVLTFPWELRFKVAKDATLLSGALSIFTSEVFRHLRRKSGVRPMRGVHCGAVTAVQRFGSALNLNCHGHSIVLDGVYVRDERTGELRFRKVAEPTKGELEEVLRRTVKRVFAFLRRKGCVLPRRGEETRDEEFDPAVLDPSVMDIVQAASIREWIGLSNDPRRVPYLGREEEGKGWVRPESKPFCAVLDGFTLHAGVRIRAGDRRGLEQLCRYVLRPPFSGERLEILEDGRVLYGFRRPRADGTSHLVLKPVEFVEKLAALVAPPRAHLVRYSGVLGPHAKVRGRVVREEAEEECGHGERKAKDGEGSPARRRRRRTRKDWATLMRRTLGLDVLACPKCGGRMRVIATIEDAEVAGKILRAMGLSDEVPPLAPACPRPPPQLELEFDQYGN